MSSRRSPRRRRILRLPAQVRPPPLRLKTRTRCPSRSDATSGARVRRNSIPLHFHHSSISVRCHCLRMQSRPIHILGEPRPPASPARKHATRQPLGAPSAYVLPVPRAAGVAWGLGAVVCEVAGQLGCGITDVLCVTACQTTMPGPCCPVACGVACCGTSDACLNATQGLCCSSDHPKTCGGRACCLSTDTCFDSTATCCAAGSTACGSQGNCCPAGTGCDALTGNCCAPGVSSCGPCGSAGQACCPKQVCAPGLGRALPGTPGANACVRCPATSTAKTIVPPTPGFSSTISARRRELRWKR